MSQGNGKYAPRPGNIPGAVRNLGGVQLVLAPLGLGKAREWETRFKEAAEGSATATPESAFELQARYVHDSLLRNYTDIDFESLMALLDTSNVRDAVDAVAMQSGMVKTPGEIQQPGSP